MTSIAVRSASRSGAGGVCLQEHGRGAGRAGLGFPPWRIAHQGLWRGTCVCMPCPASVVVAGPFTDSRPRTRVGALSRACPLLADRASIREIFAKAHHADTLRMGCNAQRSNRGMVAGFVSASYTVTEADQRIADRAMAATCRHPLQPHATYAGCA